MNINVNLFTAGRNELEVWLYKEFTKEEPVAIRCLPNRELACQYYSDLYTDHSDIDLEVLADVATKIEALDEVGSDHIESSDTWEVERGGTTEELGVIRYKELDGYVVTWYYTVP